MDSTKQKFEYEQILARETPFGIAVIGKHTFRFILPNPATEKDWKAFCRSVSEMVVPSLDEESLLSFQEAIFITKTARNELKFSEFST